MKLSPSLWLAGGALLAVSAVWAQTPVKPPAPAAASKPTTALAGSEAAVAPPPKTTIVEQIVARVNDKIITTTDYEQAEKDRITGLEQQAQQAGQTLSPADIAKAKKQLLATLIDNQLLVQRAQSLGISAETDTVLQLDQVRKENHLATMEDLQKAVEAQGENYEDYEQSVKNGILEQKVIEQDVAPRISAATPQEVAAYYNAHKAEFVRPDEVGLSEILIQTTGKPEAEQKRLKELADQVQQRAAAGEDFAKLAQRYSNASSGPQGGDIGFEQKDQLEAKLAKILFALPVGGVAPVQKVDNGYLILKVTAVHHAGQETLDEAKNEISYRLYQQKLQPELEQYLNNLRRDAYITVKPGYVDAGASADNSQVDLTKFQRVLPSDLPKPTDKPKGGGFDVNGGGGAQ
jgi:peptidyl-prolyl cis-trans isomerase SurA